MLLLTPAAITASVRAAASGVRIVSDAPVPQTPARGCSSECRGSGCAQASRARISCGTSAPSSSRSVPARCAISCRPRRELTQQHGYVHAGVVAAIADSAAGYAAMSLTPEGSEVLTVEFKLNLLAPAEGELLTARGRSCAQVAR